MKIKQSLFILLATLVALVTPLVRPTIALADDWQNPVDTLDTQTLNDLNPLLRDDTTTFDQDLTTPAGIISRAIWFAFGLGGMILFVMLIWAGFEIVSGAASKKSQDAGRQRATAAVVGFLLLFVSYWIVQLLEVIFNVAIL